MERLDRRDLRFIALCLLVIAAGAAVTSVLFHRAFPEASIKFEVDRAGARVVAEKLLEQRGRDIAGARFAGEFAVDETAKVYLERELGLEQAGKIYGREAKIWQWRMRWFRSGVKEEERVAISPLGDLIGFHTVLKEDAPGSAKEPVGGHGVSDDVDEPRTAIEEPDGRRQVGANYTWYQ